MEKACCFFTVNDSTMEKCSDLWEYEEISKSNKKSGKKKFFTKWTSDENMRYIEYLEQYPEEFVTWQHVGSTGCL